MADAPRLSDAAIERLAALIAESLVRGQPTRAAPARPPRRGESWVPAPVRPDVVTRGGEPPVWSAAAQSLEGLDRGSPSGAGRATPVGELTNLVRAAAAGRGAAPTARPIGRTTRSGSG